MSEELKQRRVCHACASKPRNWSCPACDDCAGEFHELDEPCKVLARIDAALQFTQGEQ